MKAKTFGRRKGAGTPNHAEFERTALVHFDILYSSALGMTRNVQDAEDLVQDTFLRAYRFFYRFKKGTNCKAWLFRIMKSRWISRFHKMSKGPSTISFNEMEGWLGARRHFMPPPCSDSSVFLPDLDELVEDGVKAAIDSLPPDFKMALILSDVAGFGYKEIAAIMGTPVGTVRSRLHRARGALKGELYDLASQKGILKPSGSRLENDDRLRASSRAVTRAFREG